jgi:hypothetical protein
MISSTELGVIYRKMQKQQPHFTKGFWSTK